MEILLVYPYLVSAYANGIYGLTVLLLFLLALTLGFAFELGKKALSIDSRQISNTGSFKSKHKDELSSLSAIAHANEIPPRRSSPDRLFVGAAAWMELNLRRPPGTAETVDRVSTTEANSLRVVLREPGTTDSPASTYTNLTDALAISRRFRDEDYLLRRRLINNGWIRNDLELDRSPTTDLGPTAPTGFRDWATANIEHIVSYLTDIATKYWSLLNDSATGSEAAMMAIISLGSALAIFTLLVKLTGKFVNSLALIFKSIKSCIARAAGNKKLPSFMTIFSFLTMFFKAVASQRPPQQGFPQQGFPQQGFPQQGFPQQPFPQGTTSQIVGNSPFNTGTYSDISGSSNPATISQTQPAFNYPPTTSHQFTQQTTSNQTAYTIPADTRPISVERSAVWRRFSITDLRSLTTDNYPFDVNFTQLKLIAEKILSLLKDPANDNKAIGELFDHELLEVVFKVFPIKRGDHMHVEPTLIGLALHATHVLAISNGLSNEQMLNLWLHSPDRDGYTRDNQTYAQFFGVGSEVYNLKLLLEGIKGLKHKIKTNRLGAQPTTPYNPNNICGITLQDLENQKIIHDMDPEIIRKFFEFLSQTSDPHYFTHMLKRNCGDALRMINLLLVKAEHFRTGHNRRCHYYHMLFELLNQRGIDVRIGSSPSHYHRLNRNGNNGVNDRLYTMARASVLNYEELGGYLSTEAKRLRNHVSELNDMMDTTWSSALPTPGVTLAYINISPYYHELLKHFFNHNPEFQGASRPRDAADYGSVIVNSWLVQALKDFGSTVT